MTDQTDSYENSETPNFRYYVDLLLRHRVVLFTFFVVIVTFASIFVLKLPNRYTAVAQLLFEPPEAVSSPEQELAVPTYGMKDYLTTQIQILKGVPVVREAVEKIRFHEKMKLSLTRAVQIAAASLRAASIGETRIVRVSFQSPNPDLSAEMANAISEVYIKKNVENRLYFSREILNLLPEETQHTITEQSPMGQLEELSKKEVIEALPSVQADPTLRELKQKRTEIHNELIALKKQYREQHPAVVQKEANLKFIEESIGIETRRIVENLKVAISSRLQISNVRFVSKAATPELPSGPKRLRIILLVALAELFVTCFLVISLDRLDDRIKGQEDVEKYLHLPYLGHLPLVAKKDLKADQDRALYAYYKPDSEAAEAIRYVRVGINFSAPPETLRCLLVSSSLPQEGKTFSSCNLAMSMALDGNKVLLIDSDSRRPSIHSIFKLKNDVGLTNYLTSNISLDSVVQASQLNEHLWVLPSGPASPNPSELFGSHKMRELLDQAKTQFDRVVIDAPPLTGIGDGLVAGQLVGHILLVVMVRKTRRDAVFAIKRKLAEAGIKVVGVILNSLDIERERYGYYRYHYHTYHRYYGRRK